MIDRKSFCFLSYRSVYTYCESGKERSDGSVEFDHKDYCPVNLLLQDIATHLKQQVGLYVSGNLFLIYSLVKVPLDLNELINSYNIFL